MRVSELIKMLQQKCKDRDPEIEFFAYRWNDDLEDKGDNPAWFSRISARKGKLQFFIDT